ncbi:MAG: putative nicotinate-nucleotide adenylyltransferase [Pelotomaculum sp. PtaB.Bin104]|nr:MAG: putative nicotinate-nucleotide adenylyltransferase [Pelotomaculum sp. PtaB.Bin104]
MSNSTNLTPKIGIMGGTFDPIHYGHLVGAEGVRDEVGLDQVIFVPTGRPPHKPGLNITNPWDRYLMTVLATASNDYFQVSSIEVERPGYSYTVDTVQSVIKMYPGTEIYFITGADAVLDILTWKNVELLLSICHIVAVTRPNYELDKLWEKLKNVLSFPQDRILSMEVPALAISSTDIRKRVHEGRTIKYLLPEPVEHYIAKHKLYKN